MVTPSSIENLVEVQHLKMYFPITGGLLRRKIADVKAVDNVSFTIKKGETLGLVGESGSGKTTTGRCIMRLYRPTSGRISFDGHDISYLKEKQIRPLRRKMSLIFQDPYSSLDKYHRSNRLEFFLNFNLNFLQYYRIPASATQIKPIK